VIRDVIEATATHKIAPGSEASSAAVALEATLFLDMGLSILGAPDAELDAYDVECGRSTPGSATSSGQAAGLHF